jgi:hypothetical protein
MLGDTPENNVSTQVSHANTHLHMCVHTNKRIYKYRIHKYTIHTNAHARATRARTTQHNTRVNTSMPGIHTHSKVELKPS